MDLIFGLAMVFGIGPALLFLFLGVRNYTFPRIEQPFFKDSTLFILFFVGMIAGSVLFFGMVTLKLSSNIFYMFLVAVIQLLAMVVIMNLKRFRGKSDSVFYGFGLGLGMASGMATGISFTSVSVILQTSEGQPDLLGLGLFIISVCISMSLMLGPCGMNIGEGIARHRPMEFMLQALIPLAIYDMILTVTLQFGNLGGDIAYYLSMVGILAVAAVFYYRVMYRNLPRMIKDILKTEGKKLK